MNSEVHGIKQHLDTLFLRGRSLASDPELQSHWARYLCVLVSGYLEIAVRSLLSEYARNTAGPITANYVQRTLEHSLQNPKMEKILEVVRTFSPEWEATLRKDAEGRPKDGVDSIVANRNLIAHGRSVGISLGQVQGYYLDALRVLALLDQHL